MDKLLGVLINSAEKAADVARLVREDELLFRMLVNKKESNEANPRFVEDFKTLADVLVQELVKRDVTRAFPELCPLIRGEESNVFTNQQGESIKVEIKDTVANTTALLTTVLAGNAEAAERLAIEVHRDAPRSQPNIGQFPRFDVESTTNLGIWIDPIDSTSEYISGAEVETEEGIRVGGLRCVTILVGVYDRKNGAPILGVVNQPFAITLTQGPIRFVSRCFWGIYMPTLSLSSIPDHTYNPNNRIALSATESPAIKRQLAQGGYSLVEAAGAGYKALMVITGITDAYILTKDTTYKWDTCAPHALLKSLGGGIIEFRAALGGGIKEVVYKVADGEQRKMQKCCNLGGIIAYRNMAVLAGILNILT